MFRLSLLSAPAFPDPRTDIPVRMSSTWSVVADTPRWGRALTPPVCSTHRYPCYHAARLDRVRQWHRGAGPIWFHLDRRLEAVRQWHRGAGLALRHETNALADDGHDLGDLIVHVPKRR